MNKRADDFNRSSALLYFSYIDIFAKNIKLANFLLCLFSKIVISIKINAKHFKNNAL